MTKAADLPAPPGYLLEGRYLAESLIARGPTANIFRGTDTWSGELVAIRCLRPDREDVEPRFRRRAERLFGLTSPRFLRAIHLGDDREGRPFLVTELLFGRGVQTLGRVRWEVGCEIGRQAARALAEMHIHGLHHGDLRPSTLFVVASAEGGSRVKLLDLGIGDRFATEGKDIRALAGVLHALLTGAPPLPGRTPQTGLGFAVPDAPPALVGQLVGWLHVADRAPGTTAAEMAEVLGSWVSEATDVERTAPRPSAPSIDIIVLPKSAAAVFAGESDDD